MTLRRTAIKTKRKKKCRICREWFTPFSTTQVVCGLKCALAEALEKADKRARRELRAAKERIKPRNKVQAEAQAAFNAFIRLRDEDLPCISCGETDPPQRFGGAWDCGHYRTVGAHPERRFEELNAHRQCKSCNAGSGRFSRKGRTVHQEYRERLIMRIGLADVERLEGPCEAKHYSVDDLRAIKAKYQLKKRELKKCRRAGE